MNNKYYRKKYIIGIYLCDKYESLISVCSNIFEFSQFMNISINNATVMLHNFYTGVHKYLRWKGKLCEVHFIENE